MKGTVSLSNGSSGQKGNDDNDAGACLMGSPSSDFFLLQPGRSIYGMLLGIKQAWKNESASVGKRFVASSTTC